MKIPTFDDVTEAHRRIAPHIHRTPVLTSRYLDELVGAKLFFKCENLQKSGAFKARGACNAVFGAEEAALAKGFAAHSSGNHGMALAYAAAKRGAPCTVVMPDNAPAVKKAAVRGYGGTIVECAPSNAAREEAVDEVRRQTGADFVHPFNDPRVIAGQATATVELIEQAGPLDAVIAPIGGGGLISGACLAMAELSPSAQIFAAEPENADDAYRSFKSGTLVREDAPQTIADGLKASLGELTWHFVSGQVTDVLLASEEEIVEAMQLIWQRMKIVVEPSCAVPLAALLRHRDRVRDMRIGVILTGGNVDLDALPWMKKAAA